MDFSEALIIAKEGTRITRAATDWSGRFVVVMPELNLPPFSTQDTNRKVNDRTAKHIGEDTPLNSLYFASYDLYKAQKWQPGWIPTQEDLFAEDWQAVQD